MEQYKNTKDNTLQNVGMIMFFVGVFILFFAPIYRRTESYAVKFVGFLVSLILECLTFYMIYAYFEYYKKTQTWGNPVPITYWLIFIVIYSAILFALVRVQWQEKADDKRTEKIWKWQDDMNLRFSTRLEAVNQRAFILEHQKEVDKILKADKVDIFLNNRNKNVEC